MKSLFIGIDPGKRGGICWIHWDNKEQTAELHAVKCPDTYEEMWDILNIATGSQDEDVSDIHCTIEHIWAMPWDTPKTAFTFGSNFGAWLTCLEIRGIQYEFVTPKKWQTYFSTPKLQKKERKRWLKEMAHAHIPPENNQQSVTFNTADAILLAIYGKEFINGVGMQATKEVTNLIQNSRKVSKK
tara:strand:+ start:5948 stop:6502 length:555 start_codon:yes stop_codon:yes gene_type:complete